jgi:uncharacterized membrane protein
VDGNKGDPVAYKEESVEVAVPVRTAYNQWTQFEDFPQFMEHVEEVRQLGDKRLHWRAKIAGKTIEWDAEITDQTPDRRIAWRSLSGPKNGGAVLFEPLDALRTRVTAGLDVEPEGLAENLASAFGILSSQIRGDLDRFKHFIESRGVETGAWRGEIHGQEVKR